MRGSPGEQLKAQVWKLQDVCADNGEAGGGPGTEAEAGAGGSPLAGLNCFTLQETLFVEQLTSIDERVRFQVMSRRTYNIPHTTHILRVLYASNYHRLPHCKINRVLLFLISSLV